MAAADAALVRCHARYLAGRAFEGVNRRLLHQLYEYRKETNPRVTGVEAVYAALTAQFVDKAEHNAELKKVLPKIHGNKRTLGDSLKATAAFMVGGHSNSTEHPARYTHAIVAVGRDITERKRAEKQMTAFSTLGYRLSAASTRRRWPPGSGEWFAPRTGGRARGGRATAAGTNSTGASSRDGVVEGAKG